MNLLNLHTQRINGLLSLVLGLAAITFGCGVKETDEGLDPVPTCVANSDCETGLICQAERCVDEAVEPLTISLQVQLPSERDKLTRQVTGLQFEPGISMPDFAPAELVEVKVSATRRTEVIPADISFRAERAIPGTSVDVWAQTGTMGGTLKLLPGEYDVLVVPTSGTKLPSRRYRAVQVEQAALDESVQLDLPIVNSELGERLILVRGKVRLKYLGAAEEIAGQNVRVSARTLDGQYTSQPHVTCVDDDVCDGSFELILPAQTADEERAYQLLVEPTAENDTIPKLTLGEFTVGGEWFDGSMSADTIETDLGVRLADGIPPFEVIVGTVTGGPEQQPVESAFVAATGEFGDGIEFTTAAGAPTDSAGRFELRVPNADDVHLSLKLSPPQSGMWASKTFNVDGKDDVQVNLDAKPRLTGRVAARTPDQVVYRARITANPISTAEDTELSTITETTSNEDGSYELALEPGTYDVTVQPPVTSALPLKTERIVVQPDQEMQRDVLLGETSVVFGRVMADLDVPIEGARVEVFAHDIEGKTAVKIGSAQTDEEGVYRVIVPNPDQFDFFGLTPQ